MSEHRVGAAHVGAWRACEERGASCRLALILMLVVATPDLVWAQPEGCYRFDKGYFSWYRRAPGGGTWSHDSTSMIELLAEVKPHQAAPVERRVRPHGLPADSALTARYSHFSSWTAQFPDSVAIAWHNGFSGPRLRLQLRGDSLVGYTYLVTDVVVANQPPERRAASAVRVPCPTPEPVGETHRAPGGVRRHSYYIDR